MFPAKPETAFSSSASSATSHRNLGRLIEERLRNTSYLALKGITCEVAPGSFHLRGQVSSYYLKQVAQDVASQVVDQRLVNEIEVTTRLVQNRSGSPLTDLRPIQKTSPLISE